nr:ubiquitin-like protein [Quercus suber]
MNSCVKVFSFQPNTTFLRGIRKLNKTDLHLSYSLSLSLSLCGNRKSTWIYKPELPRKRISPIIRPGLKRCTSIIFGVRSNMAMYIRVKRSKTTYFIRCDPTETVLDIKEKLQVLIDQPVNNQRLILVGTGEVLEDSKTLADHKVENDSVVALTLRKDDNEFEEVDIVRPNDFGQSRDADTGNW